MTRKKGILLFFMIATASFVFFNNVVSASCTSSADVCINSGGTVDYNPGIEKTCSEGEVWCDPKPAATFPVDPVVKLPNGMICSQHADCMSGFCDAAQAVCEDKPAVGPTPPTPPPPGGGGGGGATGNGWSLASVSGFGLPDGSILGIISGILIWLLGALGIFGVIGFVISGILYLVSTGDETMIERAKAAMTWSIVGVIVGLLGVIIIQAVDWMLRGFSNF